MGPSGRCRCVAETVEDWEDSWAARGIQLKKVGKEYTGPVREEAGPSRLQWRRLGVFWKDTVQVPDRMRIPDEAP